MTDRDALGRAICDRPADDLPRLMLCDRLEEHGGEAVAAASAAFLDVARRQAGLSPLETP